MKMNTGKDAQFSGLYSTDCCDWEQVFEKGDNLCRCPACAGLCEWELLDPPLPSFSSEEIEDFEHKVF
jgi:hypothetical protein